MKNMREESLAFFFMCLAVLNESAILGLVWFTHVGSWIGCRICCHHHRFTKQIRVFFFILIKVGMVGEYIVRKEGSFLSAVYFISGMFFSTRFGEKGLFILGRI